MSRRQTITVTLPEGRTLNPGYRLRMDGIPIEVLDAQPVQRSRREYIARIQIDEDSHGGCAAADSVERVINVALDNGWLFAGVGDRNLIVTVDDPRTL